MNANTNIYNIPNSKNLEKYNNFDENNNDNYYSNFFMINQMMI